MMSEQTLMVLHELIQASDGSRNGFDLATAAASRADLKALFHVLSIDRGAAAAELQSILHGLGIDSNDSNAGRHLHSQRTFGTFSGNTDVAMLEDIDRAEQAANATYERALSIELPRCVRSIVQRQYDAALYNHNLIRGLRNSYRTMTGAVTSRSTL